MRRVSALVMVAWIAVAMPAVGQILHASGPLPSFEVASIKLSTLAPPPPPPPSPDSNANRKPVGPAKIAPGNGGGVTTDIFRTSLPAQLLIAFAYNVPFGFERSRIFGGPGWLNTDQYEVQGKIEDSLFAAMRKMTVVQQREQMELMEQSLLADRFKLKVHFETREMAGYELVIAKGGAKLTPSKDGGNARLSMSNVAQGNQMTAVSTTIDQLIHSPFFNGRTIVDKTGLTGIYDFTLTWGSERMDASAESGSDAPSLFTAVQEQLGLKLVAAKVPVEVIVIDHVERPEGN
jgi:bla regulator protein blaR1